MEFFKKCGNVVVVSGEGPRTAIDGGRLSNSPRWKAEEHQTANNNNNKKQSKKEVEEVGKVGKVGVSGD